MRGVAWGAPSATSARGGHLPTARGAALSRAAAAAVSLQSRLSWVPSGRPVLVWCVEGSLTELAVSTRIKDSATSSLNASAATPSGSMPADRADAVDWEQEIMELEKLTLLLPEDVRASLEQHPEQLELLEVVLDLGRPPLARFPSGDVRLSDTLVTSQDLDHAVNMVGTFGGDNRAGVDRTLHRISCMRNRSGRVVGLTCRVGRAIRGSAKMIEDIVLSGASILLLGRPGVGKTTAIREISRMLAGDLRKRVVIVDTSNEIGGDGDIPHDGIGFARRMQVPDPECQHKIMIEAVENHMPEVIVIDEIGTEAEALAARTIAQRGVQLVATAHGNELENVIKNPSLADLVGGIQSVTLGDEEARRRGVQKSILERAAPPTFDVAIEMLERSKWRVHVDVGSAVDIILAGRMAGGQVRERAVDGTILRYNYRPPTAAPVAQLRGLPGTSGGRESGPDLAPRGSVARPQEGDNSSSTDEHRSSAAEAETADGNSTSSAASSRTSSSSAASSAPVADLLQRPARPDAVRSRTSRFLRKPPTVDESEDSSLESDTGSIFRSSFSIGGSTLPMATAPAADDTLLRVYPFELDNDKVLEVMGGMRLGGQVRLVSRVDQAEAVLALRPKLRGHPELRSLAKAHNVPIYAIKNSNTASLVRAFRTLLGVDPAAGGAFARGDSGGYDAAAVMGSDPLNSETAASLRAEVDIAVLSDRQIHAGRPYARAGMEDEALDEAQLAVEQIVLPLRQAVELLPRTELIMAAQMKLLARYQLSHTIVGDGADARLRVLPRSAGVAAAADEDAGVLHD